MEIIDISQTIREGMPVWPGDQKYRRHLRMQIRKGDPYNLSAITMSAHTGTHVDAPRHFFDSEDDVMGVSLERYIGPARVLELDVEGCIAAAVLEKLDLDGVQRILFKTRHLETSGLKFERRFVSLSEDGAEFLVRKNLLLVGTDAASIEAYDSRTHGCHKTLLSHGVAILEGLQLEDVRAGDYELICLPLKLAGADGSPVRAILRR